MEEVTRKGPGRPRKVVDVPNAIAEGEDANCLDNGDGETSGIGIETQAGDAGPGQDWNSFVARLKDPALRTVWFPEPKSSIIPRDHAAHLVCFVGPIKGQLNTGAFVDI